MKYPAEIYQASPRPCSQIGLALIAAYRWVFVALGGLSACAAVVAWSIPNLDLAASPFGALATSMLHDDRQLTETRALEEDRWQ